MFIEKMLYHFFCGLLRILRFQSDFLCSTLLLILRFQSGFVVDHRASAYKRFNEFHHL